jgi:hypothetical protein
VWLVEPWDWCNPAPLFAAARPALRWQAARWRATTKSCPKEKAPLDAGAYRIAILWRGDEAARRSATPETSRFKAVFAALADVGVDANPVVYEDDVPDTVRAQLGTPTSAKITTPCQVGSSLGFSRSLVAPVLPQQLQLLCSRC